MIPLPVYIASAQPNLLAGYDDFQLELARYLGSGSDSDLWTVQQVDEMDRAIQEAYRCVLDPSRIPGGGSPHVWSWKRQSTTLVTVSGTNTYTFPADFGSIHSREITYAADIGFITITPTSALDIRKRNQFSSTTAQPWLYATEWAPQVSGLSQRQRIILYPTPDAAYTLTYEYAVLIGELSKTNPYPLGGPRISQLMIEACKAVGMSKQDGSRSDIWNQFKETLGDAISMDAATNTERTVGPMRDPNRGYDEKVYSIRSTSGSTYAGIA